jgi:hypothetical protein
MCLFAVIGPMIVSVKQQVYGAGSMLMTSSQRLLGRNMCVRECVCVLFVSSSNAGTVCITDVSCGPAVSKGYTCSLQPIKKAVPAAAHTLVLFCPRCMVRVGIVAKNIGGVYATNPMPSCSIIGAYATNRVPCCTLAWAVCVILVRRQSVAGWSRPMLCLRRTIGWVWILTGVCVAGDACTSSHTAWVWLSMWFGGA